MAQASDAARPGVAPVADGPSPWGVWARGYGSWASAPSTASSASYDESGAGVILGGDAQISARSSSAASPSTSAPTTLTVANGAHNDIKTVSGRVLRQVRRRSAYLRRGSRRLRLAGLRRAALHRGADQRQRHLELLGSGLSGFYGESGYAVPSRGPAAGYHRHAVSWVSAICTRMSTASRRFGGGGAGLSVGAVDANSFATTLGARASTSLRVGNTAAEAGTACCVAA